MAGRQGQRSGAKLSVEPNSPLAIHTADASSSCPVDMPPTPLTQPVWPNKIKCQMRMLSMSREQETQYVVGPTHTHPYLFRCCRLASHQSDAG